MDGPPIGDTIFKPGLFEGQVALVTGGGTGIGLAVARELLTLGASVAICGRRSEPLEAAASALGDRIHTATCDIRDADSVAALVASVKERFGHVDVLVNNAGGQFPSPAEHISPRGFEAVVRNNLLGTWNVTQRVAAELMIPRKSGRIVSVVAEMKRGFPGMVHTGAARAGVDNMTKTLAIEWAVHGIRVNAVAPGIILSTGTAQYPREVLELGRLATPLKRFGDPREVAHLICYLSCPQADFVTGQTFWIDGGASLWGDQWPIPDEVPLHAPYELEPDPS
jgi:citronellol/citronellal dehydrogenase